MMTAKEAFLIETDLLYSIDPAYINGDSEGTEDDRKIYNAFSAVQELRLYLDKKEKSAKENEPAGGNRTGSKQ